MPEDKVTPFYFFLEPTGRAGLFGDPGSQTVTADLKLKILIRGTWREYPVAHHLTSRRDFDHAIDGIKTDLRRPAEDAKDFWPRG